MALMPARGPSEVVADLFVPLSLDVLPAFLSTLTHSQISGGLEHELMYRHSTVASPSRRRLGSEVWREQERLCVGDQAGAVVSLIPIGIAAGVRANRSGLLSYEVFPRIQRFPTTNGGFSTS
ncbi:MULTISPECIES: hypothetical protein [unclassified Cyanobium]|uniref:hypothetical protein n=1 Tax=unclassified Cyanobium TaxID=2627006 RepID=UPI0020CC24AC|nr:MULTISPECIES: hypothetical protein [unclassified Cyanobium]MCP9777871.1 hypothetical protein [Cyanobium sp. Tous-M-B4]